MMCINKWVHYGLMVALFCLQIKLPHYRLDKDVLEGIEILKCLPGTES